MEHIELISSLERCKEVVSLLKQHEILAVDLEGKHLGATGKISLIQMAVNNEKVYIFDLLRNRNMMYAGGIKNLFTNSKITKVFHACSCDCGNLFYEYGVVVDSVFDTQVAYALAQLHLEKEHVYVARGLNVILEHCGVPVNDHKDFMKRQYKRDSGFWLRRPLTERALLYAAADVISLVPDVYHTLKRKVEECNIVSEVKSQSYEQSISQADPQRFHELKKERLRLEQDQVLQGIEERLSTEKNVCFTKREQAVLKKINPKNSSLSANVKKILERCALGELRSICVEKDEFVGSLTFEILKKWLSGISCSFLDHPSTTVREQASKLLREIQELKRQVLLEHLQRTEKLPNEEISAALDLTKEFLDPNDEERYAPLREKAVQLVFLRIMAIEPIDLGELCCGLGKANAHLVLKLTLKEVEGSPLEETYHTLSARKVEIEASKSESRSKSRFRGKGRMVEKQKKQTSPPPDTENSELQVGQASCTHLNSDAESCESELSRTKSEHHVGGACAQTELRHEPTPTRVPKRARMHPSASTPNAQIPEVWVQRFPRSDRPALAYRPPYNPYHSQSRPHYPVPRFQPPGFAIEPRPRHEFSRPRYDYY